MSAFHFSPFLRRVLWADAATCLAAGLLMTLGADSLGPFLQLPTRLLLYAGLFLLPFAALLLYLATRKNFSGPPIQAVIALNVLWAAQSLLLLLTGWVAPTNLGYAFVIVQALGVGAFAGLEYVGLRRLTKLQAAVI